MNKKVSNILAFISLFITINGFSQNNVLVLDGAYVILDGGTATDRIYLIIDEPSDQGIIRLSGGHIHSENQYNYIKWLNTNGAGNYLFPFGVDGVPTDYIPFTFAKTTGGINDITVSTWTTDQANYPRPALTNVGAVTSMTGTTDPIPRAIDRFWDIQSPNPVVSDLIFSYRGIENTTTSPTGQIFAQHWNGTIWDPQVGPGIPGVTAGIGTSGLVTGQTTFSPWVLTICQTTLGVDTIAICENDSVFIGGGFQTVAGTYIDTLFNANYMGCDSVVKTTLIIHPVPVASFNPSNVCLNKTTQFSDLSTVLTGSIVDWQWNFGDGVGTSILQNPAYTYGNVGTYDVILTVTTDNGCMDSDTLPATVYALPNADFDVDAVCEDATTTFTNTSTITPVDNDVIDQYEWDFGNGATSTNENPTLDYGTEDIYNVQMVVTTNYGCKDTIEQPVTVYPLPVVVFSPTDVCLGFDTQFTDGSTVSNDHTSNNNVSWDWDFADGDIANIQNPTHTYLSDGTFNTVLTVTTDHNCVASKIIPVTVYPNPVASFTGIDLEGCAPVCPTVTSTSTINNPSIIANYNWTLSNGKVYDGSAPSFTDCYDNVTGVDIYYGLSLTVTSDKGCIDQHAESNYISVYHNPVASFYTTPDKPDVIAPEVEYHNTSLYANSYSWTIDYYGQTGEPNPLVEFPPDAAAYPAELIAYTDKGCTDTARAVVEILDRLIFYIPNTFTPDNNEFNGVFKPVFTSGYDPQTYTLYIFNRWGEKIFESHDANEGWDGTYGEISSGIVKDGTYIWKIEFKTTMNAEFKTYSGHVNLIR